MLGAVTSAPVGTREGKAEGVSAEGVRAQGKGW